MTKAIAELFIELKASVGQFSAGMQAAAKAVEDFANKATSAGKKASDGVTKELTKATAAADTFKNRLAKTAGALSVGYSLPFAGIAAAVGKAGMEFESALNDLKAKTGTYKKGMEQDFQALAKTAQEMGAATKFSNVEAAQGMSVLASAGLDVNEVFKTIRPTLDLAAASQMSVAESAEIAVGIMGAFGKEASDFAHIADVLTAASLDSSVSLGDIGYAMKHIGPTAHTAGLSLEEMAAALAMLGEAGIKGEQAGTTLKSAIARLINPTDEVIGVLKDLNISVVDSEGKFRSFDTIMGQLLARFQERNTSGLREIFAIFGEQPAPGISALLGQLEKAPSKMAEMTAKYRADISGAVKEMGDVINSGGVGAFGRMTGAIKGFQSAVYDTFKDAVIRIAGAIEAIAEAGTRLLTVFQQLPEGLRSFTAFIVTGTAVIGPLILAIGGLIAAFTLIATNPFVQGALLAGAAAGMLAFLATTETVQAGFVAAWDAIGAAFTAAYDIIANSFIGRIIADIGRIWTENSEGIITICNALMTVLNALVQGVIVPLFTEVAPSAFSAFSEAVKKYTFFDEIFSAVVAITEWMVSSIVDLLGALISYITGDYTKAWEQVKNVVPDAVRAAYNAVVEYIGKIPGIMSVATKAVDGFAWAWNKLNSNVMEQAKSGGTLEGLYDPEKEIKEGTQRAGNWLKKFSVDIRSWFKGTNDTIAEPAKKATDSITDRIKKAWSDIQNALKTGYKPPPEIGGGEKKGSRKKKSDAEKFAEKMSASTDALKDAFESLDKAVDPVAEKMAEFFSAGDLAGAEAYRNSIVKTEEDLKRFNKSVQEGKNIFLDRQDAMEEAAEREKKLHEDIQNTFKESTDALSPLADQIVRLQQAGDTGAIEALASSMKGTREEAEQFSEALSEADDHMKKLKDEAQALGDKIGDAFEKLASGLGASAGASAAIGDLFSGMVSGQGQSGTMEGIGSSIGSWFSGMWGGGGGTQGIGPVADGGAYAGAIRSGGGQNIGPVANGDEYAGMLQSQQGQGRAMSSYNWGAIAEGAVKGWQAYNDDTKTKYEKAYAMRSAGGEAAINFFVPGLGTLITQLKNSIPGLSKALDKFSVSAKLLKAFFGENQETFSRKVVERWIEKKLEGKGQLSMYGQSGRLENWNGNIIRGDSSRFNDPNWRDPVVQQFGDKAMQTFDALGEAFKRLSGVTEDVGAQIGTMLATSLNGNLDNARLLVQQMGVSFEELEAVFLDAGLKGEMSWLQVEGAIAGVEAAFQAGRVAAGDMVGAFDDLAASGGRGQRALKAVRDLGIEAMEAGVRTVEGLRDHLVASGKWAPEQIEMVMQALRQRGITSLEAIAGASDRTAGAVVADITAMGFTFSEVANEAGQIVDALAQIPDSQEKGIHFNVTSSLDANTQALVDSGQLNEVANIPQQQKAARGAVVGGPTAFSYKAGTGLMGESGPEAILPLSRINGKLGVAAAVSHASKAPTINIDARGADAEVEGRLRSMMYSLRDTIISDVMGVIVDETERGGRFGNLVGA